MNLLALIRSWWYAITHRNQVHEEVETELRFHLDAYTEDLIRSGVAERRRTTQSPPGTWQDRNAKREIP